MRRRLAAILAADIAGYTRLMGADEEGTLAALRAFRSEALGPGVAAHRGRIIKSMGDGWLIEFDSSVDAVNCAIQIQEGLRGHPLLRLRVGIHIGDIVHEDDDIFGDGVNIAARLQESAPEGGIALSDAVFGSLDGTLAPGFSDAGLHTLKNVLRPVHVWLRNPGSSGDGNDSAGIQPRQRITGFPTLAILPVERPDDRSELVDLCDALTGDLIACLSSSDWLSPRVTGSAAKGDHVLRTQLRVRGDQLRLDIALTSPDHEIVWEDGYDGTVSNSIAWQDKVGLSVAANCFGSIFDTERQRLFDRPEETLSGEDCLLCGALEYYEISEEALTSSLRYLEMAMARTPDLGVSYTLAVRCVISAIAAGFRHGLDLYLPRMPLWLDRAAALGGASDTLRLSTAIWQYQKGGMPDALEATVVDILRSSPFAPDVLGLAGWCFVWLGQPEKAIDCFRKFERYGRFSSFMMAARGGLAMALVQAGRDHAAIEQAGGVLRSTRDFVVPFRVLAAAAAHLGRPEEGRDAVNNVLRLLPADNLHDLRARAGFVDTPANQRLFDGLKMAGFPVVAMDRDHMED